MMNEKFLFPSEPSVYHLNDIAVIRLEGPDAEKYLNGQVTCDVTALPIGQSTLGAHCTPKGKVLAVFRLLKRDQDLLMLYKKELADVQLAELKKYAVFSKVTISDVSEQYDILGIAGAGTDIWQATQVKSGSFVETNWIQINPDRWFFLKEKEQPLNVSLPECIAVNWKALDIIDGIPQLSKQTQTEFIPQALNLQALHGISFTKGCYTGQEIVARAKYRGANNRALYILKGSVNQPITTETVIERQVGEHWRISGTILDVWQQKDQVLLSVVLPSDTLPDSIFRVENDQTSTLTLIPVPYSVE
jgi:folate-binding protein YgfZ